ncbi:non-ribosomal peptide synthetase-like protein [Streptomyces sp. 1114.5]|nr:non-ribosomal peptide synthetase-like protein [Streptomyces sp. 1114.5]
MWLAWRHGACLVPAPRSLVKAGSDLGPWLVERRITAVSTVPTLLALWPQECLEAVRLIIVGGEACPAELVERLAIGGREFWNTYGPTETTVVATAARLLPGRPVRIGAPLDGWEIAVVDPAGNPVPWYGSGELLITGVGTARYLDPVKDAEKFSAHPALSSPRVYRSGDLVRNDPEGLVFLGRADDQVKLGGRRIELGEIDAALQALPGIRAAAAAVRKTPAGADLLVGYLVARPHTTPDLAAARRHLLEQLPAPLVPVLALVDSLPTRTSGKVDRAALPWPLTTTTGPATTTTTATAGTATGPGLGGTAGTAGTAGPGLGGTATAAGTAGTAGPGLGGTATAAGAAGTAGLGFGGTAGLLAGQWERLLGSAPGLRDDFFVLGGSSLTAARLVSELRTRHGGVSVADLYAHPVLADLAAYLDTLTPTTAPPDTAGTATAAGSAGTAGPGFGGTAGLLAAQWERLLGSAPGLRDDFFVLGGSSLTAARLVSELRTRHGGVSVADLYAHPVLADLAAYLDTLTPTTAPPGLGGTATAAGTAGTAGPGFGGTAGLLAAQWERLLGSAPGLRDDFFVLGGSSLTAARLVSELRTRHGGVSVADLYAHPVLADLAAYLDTLTPTTAPPTTPDTPDTAGTAGTAGPAGTRDTAGTAGPGLGGTADTAGTAGTRGTAGTAGGRAGHGEPAAGVRWRPVRGIPRTAVVWQSLLLLVMFTLAGLRWILALIALDNLTGNHLSWAPHSSWWPVAAGLVLFYSAPGRTLLAAVGARVFTAGIRPGSHPRGGHVHLRLWAAERYTALFATAALAGTPWAVRYARALGCRVGEGVRLHTLPPVTGLARLGAGSCLEPEADIAGWWLDGDTLHLGRIDVGEGARIGHRATLMPGARIGARAEIAPGSCVTAAVPAGEHWHGSPARPAARPGACWPAEPAPAARTRNPWNLAYGAAFAFLGLVPVISALPALAIVYPLIDTDRTLADALLQLLPATIPLAALTLLCHAALIVLLVRLFSLPLTPGHHRADGRVAFCAWAVSRLSDTARRTLFPFYAGLFTPVWLRLLGARIGRRVEASTVLALPGLMHVDDGAFLADDTLIAPYELRGNWLRLGPAHIGRRSFVGNSGIVGPGRHLPANCLVGVLSDAPQGAPEGSSWLGRPAFALPRVADSGADARTYNPPRRLMWARAGVEACRLLPVILAALLGDLVLAVLQELRDAYGLGTALAGAGLVLIGAAVIACALTTAAKWLLVGRFRPAEHPLWSTFVWRNELYDTFVEELAMPFGGHTITGTPYLNVWLRSLGARIGRGVWCETHWLPESDLVTVEAGASVNRGTVLQTHLFHDRVMRLGPVHLGAGSTTGPHSIVLLNATLGAGACVGPASLVMRGENVPGATRWLGNPVAAWNADPTPPPGRRAQHGRRRSTTR